MDILANVLNSTIIFAVPLLLVALGGMFSERSGVINLSLEGIMIMGALFSCIVLNKMNLVDGMDSIDSFGAQNPILAMFIAILVAAAVGMIYALLLAFAAINLRADQTIGGTALNMLAPGLAVVVTWAIQGQGQTTVNIPTWVRITQANFGGEASIDGFFNTLIFRVPVLLLIGLAMTVFGIRRIIQSFTIEYIRPSFITGNEEKLKEAQEEEKRALAKAKEGIREQKVAQRRIKKIEEDIAAEQDLMIDAQLRKQEREAEEKLAAEDGK
jgi:hypothetical protein